MMLKEFLWIISNKEKEQKSMIVIHAIILKTLNRKAEMIARMAIPQTKMTPLQMMRTQE